MSEQHYQNREIDSFMEEIKETLLRIEIQTTKHNGRMRSLEMWKAGIVGAMSIFGIVASLIIYIWNSQISQIKASESQIALQLQNHINK